jgi:3-hydroxyacyl-CoA dehydrogenase / enoyl-CoA hydratase / 3-hydroxybutyryl-CoA epimerase
MTAQESTFHYGKDNDGIVTVTMDMTGPVNSVNPEFTAALTTTLTKLENEQDLSGVVITSAKDTFVAGADLKHLLAVEPGTEAAFFEERQTVIDLMRRLETLPVPVVAAVNGAALGGGYELCLACHHRIAWNNKKVVVGLPEAGLGLLPGGGGVVRLTKLLGLQKALPLLLEGKRINANEAPAAGLIDQLVDTLDALIPAAKAWILENKNNENASLQPWDQKDYKIPGGTSDNPAVNAVAQKTALTLYTKNRGTLPAPEKILDVATQATKLDLQTALQIEGRAFIALLYSPQTKNMINTNFFQMNQVKNGASRPNNIPTSKITKVGVIGAGMMGQGIAYVSAKAGIEVVLKDVSLDAAEKGKSYSEKVLDKLISRGQIEADNKQTVLNLIQPTDKDNDLEGCNLIIEAVFENMPLKNQITQQHQGYLAKNGIWASNTSTLPITLLAEASHKPSEYIGIHFFSPVDKMKLVEIIAGKDTSDETLAKAFDYVQQIKKTPIVVNDSLGFFTSRVFITPLSEATALVVEGIHPVRIENLGKALGMPVGPLASYDEVSQRLSLDVTDTQIEMGLKKSTNDPTPEGTAMIRSLVTEHGRGGRRHGGGFYEYNDEGKHIWPTLIEQYHRPELSISDQDIKDRLLFRAVIESLKCLEEGVLRSVADGNIGSLIGIGAPTWTGGYIQFVNTYGLDRFIERCNELAEKYGDRFKAPDIVIEKSKTNELF